MIEKNPQNSYTFWQERDDDNDVLVAEDAIRVDVYSDVVSLKQGFATILITRTPDNRNMKQLIKLLRLAFRDEKGD